MSRKLTPLALRLARKMERSSLHPTARNFNEFLQSLGGPQAKGDVNHPVAKAAINELPNWFPSAEYAALSTKRRSSSIIYNMRRRLARPAQSEEALRLPRHPRKS